MRRVIAVCLVLAVATLAAYWPVFQNGFVSYDDPSYVTENAHVLHGFNWADAQWALGTNHAGNWHPLTWLSHMLDVSLFGIQPAGHHLTSLLLHIANSLLLFLLLEGMTGATWRSALAAGLFALHPLHVESVAWVAERKDVLSTFFMLLSLLAYWRYVRGIGSGKPAFAWSYYFLSALLFACGLMSKPMLVTLPFVLLLLDFWPLKRLQFMPLRAPASSITRILLEKIPFLALSAGSCVVTFVIQRGAGAVNTLGAVPVELRVSNALISYLRYLANTLWPANLAAFYPLPREWPLEFALVAAVILAVITGVTLWRVQRAPYLAVGWLWFVGTLTPVVGFVQVGQQAMADRYTYIPSIGLFVMLVWALGEIPLRWPVARPWLAAAGACVLGACALLTWRQVTFWHDTRTLFTHALAVTTDNQLAHNNLGIEFLNAGDISTAAEHFSAALAIRPRYADALANLALCREQQNVPDEAISLFEQALEVRPTASIHYNLANILMKQGRLPEAEAHYQAALKLDPEFVEAWLNFGNVLAKQSRVEEARAAYATAARLKPGNADAHLTLGASLAGQKRYDEAIAEFNLALQAAPENADAHFNLASAFQAKGDFANAATQFAEACRLRPDDVEARRNLAFVLLALGKMSESAAQFEQVVRVRPDAGAHYYLAIALDAQGKGKDAATHYREALRLAPNNPAYLNDLAWLLATSPDDSVRNGSEAVRLAESATQLSSKEARFWGTLDAAYAEAGRFDDAIATATKTRDLALAAHQDGVASAADQRLALYRLHKPFHSAPPQAPSAPPQ